MERGAGQHSSKGWADGCNVDITVRWEAGDQSLPNSPASKLVMADYFH